MACCPLGECLFIDVFTVGKYILFGLSAITVMSATVFALDPFGWQGTEYTVNRTANGYEPNSLTIALGDTVIFENSSNEHHWPASDLHPTHTIYLDFDPDRPLAPNEPWSFRFKQAGKWYFHDHLKANLVGVIKVTP